MPSNGQPVLLKDIVDIYDGPHATPKKTAAGPYFLGISNLVGGRIDLSSPEYLSEDDFERWTRRVTPSPGDLVFSYETRLGQAALVPPGFRGCLGRRMGLMRVRDDLANKRFLLYAYLGPQFQETIRERTIHGSTVDRIPLIDMPEFPISLPDRPTQDAVASVLGSFDDKVELNRKMIATLEAMARSLFAQSLDQSAPRIPVRKFLSNGDLFIGDGYRAKNTELGEPGLPFVRAGNLREVVNTRSADVLRYDSVVAARAQNKISEVGDVAFTSKGTIGRFARVTDSTHSFVYSPQVCFWRSLNARALPPEWLYLWMTSNDFMQQVNMVAHQTDMAPYVSLSDQRAMTLPEPTPSSLEIIPTVRLLLERIACSAAEQETLAVLRNTLLPKLISGDIGISETERILEKTA